MTPARPAPAKWAPPERLKQDATHRDDIRDEHGGLVATTNAIGAVEEEALAAEIVRRWNCHAQLVAALESLIGNTPWRRAEPPDGCCQTDEPWVCVECASEIRWDGEWDVPGSSEGVHRDNCAWREGVRALAAARKED